MCRKSLIASFSCLAGSECRSWKYKCDLCIAGYLFSQELLEVFSVYFLLIIIRIDFFFYFLLTMYGKDCFGGKIFEIGFLPLSYILRCLNPKNQVFSSLCVSMYVC